MKSLKKGRAARDAAMDETSGGANEAWKEATLDAIHATAKRRDKFIVDDIWPHFIPAKPRGICEPLGRSCGRPAGRVDCSNG